MYSIKNCSDTYITLHLKTSKISMAARGMVHDISKDQITADIRSKHSNGLLALIWHEPEARKSGKVTIARERMDDIPPVTAKEETKAKNKKENK